MLARLYHAVPSLRLIHGLPPLFDALLHTYIEIFILKDSPHCTPWNTLLFPGQR